MTAKEKARELIFKMELAQSKEIRGCNYDTAKQCALICVDETFEATADLYTAAMDKRGFNENLDYWNEVKQEINKL